MKRAIAQFDVYQAEAAAQIKNQEARIAQLQQALDWADSAEVESLRCALDDVEGAA